MELVISRYPNNIERIIIKDLYNIASFPSIYPNMFGELYIGIKNLSEYNFNKLVSVLENSYLIQSNFDLSKPNEYIEEVKNIRIKNHIVSDPFNSSFLNNEK